MLSERAELIAKKRLFLKNEEGVPIEDYQGMVSRVATHLGNSPEEVSSFYSIMSTQEFLPNSPCLVNAGVSGRPNQLSACFVLPVEDSLGSIFDSVKEVALIHKSGGGTGMSFSRLRPKDSIVASTRGVSSGPVSFMKVFDGATEAIKQGGVRRGANMGVLRVDHPDIMDYITCKANKKDLQNFNLSVAITDKFMQAVIAGVEYELVNPATGEITSSSAKKVWEAIVNNAHESGDPGLLFIDRINQHNPLTGKHNEIEATNPCVTGDTLILTTSGYKIIANCVDTEQIIWNGYRWSKVLVRKTGINQALVKVTFSNGQHIRCTPYHKFIVNDKDSEVRLMASELKGMEQLPLFILPQEANGSAKLVDVYISSIRSCSEREDVYCFNEPYNHSAVFNGILTAQCGEQPLAPWEACGLGSINLALMITNGQINFERLRKVVTTSILLLNRMMQKSEYPNEKIASRVDYSRKIGLGVMGFADLLIKLKVPYSSPDAVEIAENIAVTILDSATLATHKLGLVEGKFPAFHEYVMPQHIKDSLHRLGISELDYCPANSTLTTIAPTGTISMIAECSASIEPVYKFVQFENRADTVIEHHHPLYANWKSKFPNATVPSYYEEAHDIQPSQHIAIQAIFQKYCCSGVSKTINLPSTASKLDVANCYLEAYKSGCKGITIYRDGSLENQVLSGSAPSASSPASGVTPKARPEILSGKTYQIKTGFGEMLVTVNYNNSTPFEIICQLGKSGASEMAKAEAISRLCSILLRCGVPVDILVGQLEGIVGSDPVHTKYGLVLSIPDAISKILTHHVLGEEQHSTAIPAMMKCKDCGKSHGLVKVGSCIKCTVCGWESCSG